MNSPDETKVVVVQPDQPSTALATASNPLSVIQMAIDKGVNAEQLSRLMDLQERYESGRARMAYTRALNKAQADMPPIFKGSRNDYNKKTYASLEDILRVVRPVYLANDFSFTFGQEPSYDKEGWARLYLEVSHVEGHTERYYGDFPLDSAGSKGGNNKSDIQSVGSMFSYGRRYLIGLVFNLVFTDDKDDNDGYPQGQEVKRPDGYGPPYPQGAPKAAPQQQQESKPAPGGLVSRDQIALLMSLVSKKGANKERFLAWAGAKRYEDLTVAQWEKAVSQLGTMPDKAAPQPQGGA